MNANEVVGKYLLAQRDCRIYDRPDGNVIGNLTKGIVYGPVYSYVEKDGNVWWMFDYSLPGQAPGAWYVKHTTGAFKVQESGIDNEKAYFGGMLSEAIVSPKKALVKYWWLALVLILPYLLKLKK
jgi:hypothetical protein